MRGAVWGLAAVAACGGGARPALGRPGEPAPQQEPADAPLPDLTGADDKAPESPWEPSIPALNVGYGPLRIPSQSPFQALRFGFLPRTPSTIAAGQVELRTSETWVNMFAMQEDEYLLDFEMLRSGIGVAYGLSDELEVDLEFVDKSRFGGRLDGFVRGFHDAFGIRQAGRDDVPNGGFAFDIQKNGGKPPVSLSNRARGSFSRELALAFQHNVTPGTETTPAIAYTLTLGFETNPSEDLKEGRSPTVAPSVSVAKGFGDVYAYVSGGVAWFGKEEFSGIELRPIQASVMLALEWRFSAAASLITQYLVSQGVAEHLGPFSTPSHEVTLGWKVEIWQGAVLEVGVIENVLVFDNSPDFGIHSGFTYRF